MRRALLPLAALFAAALATLPLQQAAFAQDQATLVADSVVLESENRLVATGHVEVFFKGQHITAAKVIYDAAADRLQIEGPIRIEDGQGGVILADGADLSADLTEGLITTARLVMGQQLQLAAAELARSGGGTVTAMRRVVASSCKVCGDGPPLWEIRAAEVVHDAAAQQIWFTGATLRFVGVPVIWLPVLRIPDPTLDRATGFLMPGLRSSTALGTGVTLPYFITLGRSRDLTLTPFLTNSGGQTLGWRYRQAFSNGSAEISGAFSRDGLKPTDLRGYLQAKAGLSLGNGWFLALDGTVVGDPAYLQDYGISDSDRLTSSLTLSRVSRDSFTQASLRSARTLRAFESNATQPSVLVGVEAIRRFEPPALGGVLTLSSAFAAQRRNSSSGADANGDGMADGRDMRRFTLGADWTRRWVSEGGVVLDAGLQAGADLYAIAEDDIYAGRAVRSLARGGVKLSLPMLRQDDGGTTLVTPALQLVTARTHATAAIPNEDSRLVEFDEANLFAFDRHAGADAVETGTHLALGLSASRQSQSGASWDLTLGRVFRLEPSSFTTASGLGGTASDWLIAGQMRLGPGSVITRATFDDEASLQRFESRFSLAGSRAALSGGYEVLDADPDQGRSQDVREVVMSGWAKLGQFWVISGSDRYDLSTETTRASLSIGFRNECLAVDLSVSRRFTSSSIVAPSSDVGLTVELLGLGGASTGQAATTCRR